MENNPAEKENDDLSPCVIEEFSELPPMFVEIAHFLIRLLLVNENKGDSENHAVVRNDLHHHNYQIAVLFIILNEHILITWRNEKDKMHKSHSCKYSQQKSEQILYTINPYFLLTNHLLIH
jgi:hypothetical protein